jgi:hypothetical protein
MNRPRGQVEMMEAKETGSEHRHVKYLWREVILPEARVDVSHKLSAQLIIMSEQDFL